MIKMSTLIAISLGVVLSACAPVKKVHVKVKQSNIMHVYKVHNTQPSDGDEWIYWYIMYANNNTYYYSSSETVSTFNTVAFTKAEGISLPKEVEEQIAGQSEVQATEIDDPNNLPEAAQTDVPTVEVEVPVDTTEDQINDMISEGGPVSSSDDSTSDSSSSDSSSSDSGGGSDGGGGE